MKIDLTEHDILKYIASILLDTKSDQHKLKMIQKKLAAADYLKLKSDKKTYTKGGKML